MRGRASPPSAAEEQLEFLIESNPRRRTYMLTQTGLVDGWDWGRASPGSMFALVLMVYN